VESRNPYAHWSGATLNRHGESDRNIGQIVKQGQGRDLLIEKEPVVNTFISVPKDKGMLNCAAFVAGIIQAMLDASNFPCQVSAHWWNNGTAYVIRFEELVISREAAMKCNEVDKAHRKKGRFNTKAAEFGTVEWPLEDVFFFDVETCVLDGQLPTLAVALSAKAWYCWCSERLVHLTPVPLLARLEHLIPLGGSEKPRVAIGHNVGYDRARAREPYEKKKTLLRFMDTMSMAIPMFGMADHQVVTYETDDSDFTLREKLAERWRDTWDDRVCRNSLLAVHQHLYRDKLRMTKQSKQFQEFFVKEDIHLIQQNFQVLVNYCADDNLACCQIFKKLWLEYQNRLVFILFYR
ncbi:transport protein particle component, Bet3, partial [Teladorsagia circumcincta]